MNKPKIILLVDDDFDDQQFFMEAVEAIGGSHKCLIANDGEQAFRLLTRNNPLIPDYIFLDLNMPLVSGKDVLKRLRGTEETKALRVIVYSTTISQKDIEDTQGYNVEYLQKPSDFETLCKRITDILKP